MGMYREIILKNLLKWEVLWNMPVRNSPVEEGHRTRGSTFVQGRFMLKDSIDKNKDKLQQKINDKLSRLK